MRVILTDTGKIVGTISEHAVNTTTIIEDLIDAGFFVRTVHTIQDLKDFEDEEN